MCQCVAIPGTNLLGPKYHPVLLYASMYNKMNKRTLTSLSRPQSYIWLGRDCKRICSPTQCISYKPIVDILGIILARPQYPHMLLYASWCNLREHILNPHNKVLIPFLAWVGLPTIVLPKPSILCLIFGHSKDTYTRARVPPVLLYVYMCDGRIKNILSLPINVLPPDMFYNNLSRLKGQMPQSPSPQCAVACILV